MANAFPTEQDRLRSLLTAGEHNGDLEIDRVRWRLAELRIHRLYELMKPFPGFNTTTLASRADFCELEAALLDHGSRVCELAEEPQVAALMQAEAVLVREELDSLARPIGV